MIPYLILICLQKLETHPFRGLHFKNELHVSRFFFFFLSNIRTPQHVHVWVHIHAVTHTHLPTPEGHAGYKQLPAAVASASALTLLHPSAHSRQPANSTKKYTPKRRLVHVLSGRTRQPLLQFVFLNVRLSSQCKILL